jgi:hypothetical protein
MRGEAGAWTIGVRQFAPGCEGGCFVERADPKPAKNRSDYQSHSRPPLAEFALSCLSRAFIYASFLTLDAAFERLGASPLAARRHCPARPGSTEHFIGNENFSALGRRDAAAGIALYLARALALDARDRRPTWLELGLLAGGGGLMTLFSEAAALACYGILVAAIVERRKAFE